jgi:hypothetical protein
MTDSPRALTMTAVRLTYRPSYLPFAMAESPICLSTRSVMEGSLPTANMFHVFVVPCTHQLLYLYIRAWRVSHNASSRSGGSELTHDRCSRCRLSGPATVPQAFM